jgi:hypothetical protein
MRGNAPLTEADLVDPARFERIACFSGAKPGAAMAQEWRTRSPVVVGYTVLVFALLAATIWFGGRALIPWWAAVVQALAGIVLCATLGAWLLLCMESAIMRRQFPVVQGLELDLGEEEAVANLRMPGVVQPYAKVRARLLIEVFGPTSLLVLGAAAFPAARPFFLASALTMLLTNLGAVMVASMAWRARGRERFLTDRSDSDESCLYAGPPFSNAISDSSNH